MLNFSMRLPDKPKTTREIELQERLDKYMEGIRREVITHLPHLSADERQRDVSFANNYNKVRDCLNLATGQMKVGNVSSFVRTASDCDNVLRQLSGTQYDVMLRNGLEEPTKFLKRLEKEREQGQAYRANAQKEDVIKVVDEFVAFNPIEVEGHAANDTTAGAMNLASQVSSVLLELNRSDDVQSLAKNLSPEKMQELGDELSLELVRLGELIALLSPDAVECPGVQVTRMDLLETHSQDFLQRGFVLKDSTPQHAGEAFFSVTPDQLEKIQAFKIVEGEEETWLYRSKNPGGLEEVWVMAKWDAERQGVVYSHFVVRDGLQEGILDRYEGLNVLNRIRTGVSRHQHDRTTVFETEVGVRIDADFEELLNIGKVPIPSGKVYVAGARLRSFTPKFGSDNRLEVGIDRVEVVSGLFGTDGNWSVAAKMSYKTFDNKWKTGVEARVYNIIGGYSSDLTGKDEFHMGLMGRQNYVTVQTGGSGPKLNVGREFASQKGGATISTDFKKSVELKIFIMLD